MSRLAAAAGWAFVTAALFSGIAFSTPLIIGGRGSHQGPLLAFALAPVAFGVAFVVTLIQPRLGKFVALAVLTYPAWYYLGIPKDEAPELLPLTAEERDRLRATRFDLRVAVANGGFPEAYQAGLVRELNDAGLFKAVGRVGDVESPDLIATVTGNYYGDREGQHFSLHLSGHPERKVHVNSWHYIPGALSQGKRSRYKERFAIEVIRKIDELGFRSATTGVPREGAQRGASASERLPWRAAIVPQPAARDDARPADPERPRTPGRLSWATLLRRVFAHPINYNSRRGGDRSGSGHASLPSAGRAGARGRRAPAQLG